MGGYPYKIDGNRIDEHILKYADEFDELTVGGSLFSQFYQGEYFPAMPAERAYGNCVFPLERFRVNGAIPAPPLADHIPSMNTCREFIGARGGGTSGYPFTISRPNEENINFNGTLVLSKSRWIIVHMVAGGGGGGSGKGFNFATNGGGGGGGGAGGILAVCLPLPVGASYSGQVGHGGTGQLDQNNAGGAGGASYIQLSSGTKLQANGGGGGAGGASRSGGGGGGVSVSCSSPTIVELGNVKPYNYSGTEPQGYAMYHRYAVIRGTGGASGGVGGEKSGGYGSNGGSFNITLKKYDYESENMNYYQTRVCKNAVIDCGQAGGGTSGLTSISGGGGGGSSAFSVGQNGSGSRTDRDVGVSNVDNYTQAGYGAGGGGGCGETNDWWRGGHGGAGYVKIYFQDFTSIVLY
jgi:hypothetical protein